MSKKIYVGNLSFDTNDDQLNQIFAPFGTVSSARVIKDKYTDRSRGFGFVEMDNAAEADKAIAELNGKNVNGRDLNINEAKPREDKPRGGGYGGGSRERY
ncbi:MAG: RNA-binding protein [Candidatus Krumholzibacteria bacterium]|nr:RNA-binding protein [Candidatus Krumholzibacteria bacterium]